MRLDNASRSREGAEEGTSCAVTLIVGAPARGSKGRATGIKRVVTTVEELEVDERGLEKKLWSVDDAKGVEDELIVVVRPKHVPLHVGYQSSRLSPTSRQNKQPEGLNTARRP